MDSDFWNEHLEDVEGFEWDDVERISVFRDESDWTVWIEQAEEGWVEVGPFDDETMEDEFWNDLYWWAMENDIEIDREIGYGEEAA